MKICIFGNRENTLSLIKVISRTFPRSVIDLVTLHPKNGSVTMISGFYNNLKQHAAPYISECLTINDYKLREPDFLEVVSKKQYDLGLSMGWQRIIPENILEKFQHGIYGWHGSCFQFPNGRGRSPLNWSIRLGANKIYLNLFKYSTGVDDGKIYKTYQMKISNSDYISDVQKKVLSISLDSAKDLIQDLLLNRVTLREQYDHPFVSFPKLSDESGELFPERMNVIDAYNIIRSCSKPFPGAFIRDQENQKIRVWRGNYTVTDSVKKDTIVYKDNKIFIKFIDGMITSSEYEKIK